MPRYLFTGPAGTGKTHACLDLFAEQIARDPLAGAAAESFYILPNREHADRVADLLASDSRLKGIAGVRILTISDFIRYKTVRPGERLATQFDRRECVARVLRQNPDNWSRWLGDAAKRQGIARLLAGFLRELSHTREGLPAAERILARWANEAKIDAPKYAELGRLIGGYRRQIADWELNEPEDLLRRFAAEEPGAAPQGLVVWDGFFSFTEAQMLFVLKIAASAQTTLVTLSLDEERPNVFAYPLRMRRVLLQNGFVERRFGPVHTPRFVNPLIGNLASRLFARKITEDAGQPAAGGPVTVLIEASDRIAEIRAIAGRILRNRVEHRIAFADQMVLLRSIKPYERPLREIFGSLGVPVQVHERARLADHLLAKSIAAWLSFVLSGGGEAAADTGQAPENAGPEPRRPRRAWFDWFLWELRLGGFQARAAEVAAVYFDNIEPILGREFAAECAARLPAELEPAARSAMDRIARFDRISSGEDWAAFCAELLAAARKWSAVLIPRDRNTERVARILETEFMSGAALMDRRGSAVYGIAARLKDAIEMGLYSESRLAADCVQVYDAVLALPKEYRAVFVAGLSDDQFPQKHREHAVLKDSERLELRERGLRLDTAAEMNESERYFFYMAVTRATERLVLSRPLMDGEGGPLFASAYWEEARHAAGESIEISRFDRDDFVSDPLEWRALCDPAFAAARAYRLGDKALEKLSDRILSVPARLGCPKPPDWICAQKTRHERFGSANSTGALPLNTIAGRVGSLKNRIWSATALDRIENCSYQYFADYWLGLKDAPQNEGVERIEGNLLHTVFEKAIRSFEGRLAAGVPESEWVAAFLRVFDEELARDPFEALIPSERIWRISNLRRLTAEAAAFEFTRLRKRPLFVPSLFEIPFGEAGAGPIPTIDTPIGPIRFGGRIDRVDTDRSGRAVIVDYKRTAPKGWDIKKPDTVPFQPVLYGLAAPRALGLRPLNIEWVALSDCRSGVALKLDAATRKKMKLAEGDVPDALSTAEWDEAVAVAADRIARSIRRVEQKGIVAQSRSCDRCRHSGLCRVEEGEEEE